MHCSKPAKFKSRLSGAITVTFLTFSMSACAGLTTSNTPTSSTPNQTAMPQETSQPFRFGVPVESESQALIAAEAALRSSFDYAKPLTVVKVEQTTYGDYSKRMGAGSDRPPDMKIWLVIYLDSQFQSIAPRPDVTPSPPFRGCVSVVVNAADGLPMETGGPLQQGKVAECDK
jgi:hypothetical protein